MARARLFAATGIRVEEVTAGCEPNYFICWKPGVSRSFSDPEEVMEFCGLKQGSVRAELVAFLWPDQ